MDPLHTTGWVFFLHEAENSSQWFTFNQKQLGNKHRRETLNVNKNTMKTASEKEKGKMSDNSLFVTAEVTKDLFAK